MKDKLISYKTELSDTIKEAKHYISEWCEMGCQAWWNEEGYDIETGCAGCPLRTLWKNLLITEKKLK